MAKSRELTPTNFLASLDAQLGNRFHPTMRESRIEEARRALRDIVGENAWDKGILNAHDIVTLYYVADGRQANYTQMHDDENAIAMRYVRNLIKDTGVETFGMRDNDFAKQKADMRQVDRMLNDPGIAIKTTNPDTIVEPVKGGGKRGLFSEKIHAETTPESRRIRPAEAAKHTKKHTKKENAVAQANEPKTSRGELVDFPTARPIQQFSKRWEAIAEFCLANDMNEDGLTSFFAKGPISAMQLDQATFTKNYETATKALGWMGVDSKQSRKLLSNLADAYHDIQQARESGRNRG